jgi:hypothetical protein
MYIPGLHYTKHIFNNSKNMSCPPTSSPLLIELPSKEAISLEKYKNYGKHIFPPIISSEKPFTSLNITLIGITIPNTQPP